MAYLTDEKFDAVFSAMELLYANSTQNPTPAKLVKQMLDKLPEELWKNPGIKLFDPAMGRGTFLLDAFRRFYFGLAQETPDVDERIRHILSHCLHGSDIDESMTGKTKAAFSLLLGYDIDNVHHNLHTYNSLKEYADMKFDVVVGNPPYQGRQDAGNKTHSLWKKFIKFSTTIADIVVFVTPATWINDKKTMLFFDGGYLYAKLLRHNEFPVGVDLSYWIWQRGKGSSLIEILDGNVIPLQGTLPTSLKSIIDCQIQQKLQLGKFFVVTQEPIYYAHKEKSDEMWPIYNTTSQGCCWSPLAPTDMLRKKVMFSNCGAYKAVYDAGTMGTCWHSHAIFVDNDAQGQNLLSFMHTNLMKFYAKINRVGGFIGPGFCGNIPNVDITHLWDNEQAYVNFNLTPEEIDYVERNTK